MARTSLSLCQPLNPPKPRFHRNRVYAESPIIPPSTLDLQSKRASRIGINNKKNSKEPHKKSPPIRLLSLGQIGLLGVRWIARSGSSLSRVCRLGGLSRLRHQGRNLKGNDASESLVAIEAETFCAKLLSTIPRLGCDGHDAHPNSLPTASNNLSIPSISPRRHATGIRLRF